MGSRPLRGSRPRGRTRWRRRTSACSGIPIRTVGRAARAPRHPARPPAARSSLVTRASDRGHRGHLAHRCARRANISTADLSSPRERVYPSSAVRLPAIESLNARWDRGSVGSWKRGDAGVEEESLPALAHRRVHSFPPVCLLGVPRTRPSTAVSRRRRRSDIRRARGRRSPAWRRGVGGSGAARSRDAGRVRLDLAREERRLDGRVDDAARSRAHEGSRRRRTDAVRCEVRRPSSMMARRGRQQERGRARGESGVPYQTAAGHREERERSEN